MMLGFLLEDLPGAPLGQLADQGRAGDRMVLAIKRLARLTEKINVFLAYLQRNGHDALVHTPMI